MFRQVVRRLTLGALLVVSIAALTAATGGSAGVNFVTSTDTYSHDGSTPSHDCPGVGINERHYCLVLTTYDHLKKSGGIEVDLTLQNYDQSTLSNPVTKLEWDNVRVPLNLDSTSGPASCSNPSSGLIQCGFPNLPGLGSSAVVDGRKPCPPLPPEFQPPAPICSTEKLFFSVNTTEADVPFTATANVKESQTNGANVDSQMAAATMVFDDDASNTGGDNADATVVLPQADPTVLHATKSSVKFIGGSRPFLAQFRQDQLQPTTPGVCFPGIGCTGLQLTTDLAAAPSGTFSKDNPIVWQALVNATNTNVLAVHYYDPVSITGSPSAKTFTTGGTRFASCDGVNFTSAPGGDVKAGTDYFVIKAAADATTNTTTFQVAATATGKALSFTGSGEFFGSCIRVIGDQKAEKTGPCTGGPPAPPAQLPALCAVKQSSGVLVYVLDDANGGIHY